LQNPEEMVKKIYNQSRRTTEGGVTKW